MCDAWHQQVKHERSYVKVSTSDGEDVLGFMYACDPETGNIGLLSPGPTVHLIFSADVTSVSAASGLPKDVPTTLPTREERKSSELSCEVVLDGLRHRRIDAEVREDAGEKYVSVFGGIATVRPPYTPGSCRSTNENVLLRVKQVLAEIHDAQSADRGMQCS